MKQRTLFNLGRLFASFLLAAQSAAAAIYNVSVNEASFSPALLTIHAGDTVVWENVDDFFFHTTTSDLAATDPNFWTGFMLDQGDTFEHTFDSVGTFTYHDQYGNGHGTITVQAIEVPPLISLDSPRQAGGQFVFDATGLTVGKTNVLLASTNLTGWVAIKTNVASNASMTFTNAMTLPRRFFRLLEQP